MLQHGETSRWHQYGLTSVLQPIVHLKDHEIIGVEALVRATDPHGTACAPARLFNEAASAGEVLQLDRLCREEAFRAYSSPALNSQRPDILFVNINSSLLDDPARSEDYLLSQVRTWNLKPEQIAIEVVENSVQTPTTLFQFVERYRRHGFLIALDDFGASHSNLERLVDLKPDVVKIDRNLVSGVHDSHYKRSVVEAINGLCHSLGATSLAEGVETQEELECLTSLGCDLFQGFLLSAPLPNLPERLAEINTRIHAQATQAGNMVAESAKRMHESAKKILDTGRDVARRLEEHELADDSLLKLIEDLPGIQCAYLIDLEGIQITETVFNPAADIRHRSLFKPASRGADHSLKDYVYHIRSLDAPRFLSGVYLSRATGTLCRTVSVRTCTRTKTPVILCLDIVQQQ